MATSRTGRARTSSARTSGTCARSAGTGSRRAPAPVALGGRGGDSVRGGDRHAGHLTGPRARARRVSEHPASRHVGGPPDTRPSTTPPARPSPGPSTTPATRQLLLAQLRTGDCLTGPNLGLGNNNPWPRLSTAVPCSQPHLAEVFFADNAYWQPPFPGDTTITHDADAQCDRVYTAYVGIPVTHSAYTWDDIFPDAVDWSNGDRELVCAAFRPTSSAPGGTPISGSVKGSRR